MQNTKYKKQWSIYSANKFRRLANGTRGCIKGTNTIQCICKYDMPAARRKDVTYGQFVCNVRPEKKRNSTAHDLESVAFAPTTLVKLPHRLLKCLSPKFIQQRCINTRDIFMTMDISIFYRMTPLKQTEYIRINIRDIL